MRKTLFLALIFICQICNANDYWNCTEFKVSTRTNRSEGAVRDSISKWPKHPVTTLYFTVIGDDFVFIEPSGQTPIPLNDIDLQKGIEVKKPFNRSWACEVDAYLKSPVTIDGQSYDHLGPYLDGQEGMFNWSVGQAESYSRQVAQDIFDIASTAKTRKGAHMDKTNYSPLKLTFSMANGDPVFQVTNPGSNPIATVTEAITGSCRLQLDPKTCGRVWTNVRIFPGNNGRNIILMRASGNSDMNFTVIIKGYFEDSTHTPFEFSRGFHERYLAGGRIDTGE